MSKNSEVALCVKYIEKVTEEVVPLYDCVERMILPHIDLDVIRGLTLDWMSNAGRSAESGMTSIEFEKHVRLLESIGNINVVKILII